MLEFGWDKIFIGITFDFRQVLAINLSLSTFELKHVLLHNLLFLKPGTLIFDLPLWMLSQSLYLLFKGLQLSEIGNPSCLLQFEKDIFLDFSSVVDLELYLTYLKLDVVYFSLDLVCEVLVFGVAFIFLQVIDVLLQSGYLLVAVLKLPLQGHWHRLLLLLLLMLPVFESKLFPAQLLCQARTDLYQLLPQILVLFCEFVEFWVKLYFRFCLRCGYWDTLSNCCVWRVYYWLFCL